MALLSWYWYSFGLVQAARRDVGDHPEVAAPCRTRGCRGSRSPPRRRAARSARRPRSRASGTRAPPGRCRFSRSRRTEPCESFTVRVVGQRDVDAAVLGAPPRPRAGWWRSARRTRRPNAAQLRRRVVQRVHGTGTQVPRPSVALIGRCRRRRRSGAGPPAPSARCTACPPRGSSGCSTAGRGLEGCGPRRTCRRPRWPCRRPCRARSGLPGSWRKAVFSWRKRPERGVLARHVVGS